MTLSLASRRTFYPQILSNGPSLLCIVVKRCEVVSALQFLIVLGDANPVLAHTQLQLPLYVPYTRYVSFCAPAYYFIPRWLLCVPLKLCRIPRPLSTVRSNRYSPRAGATLQLLSHLVVDYGPAGDIVEAVYIIGVIPQGHCMVRSERDQPRGSSALSRMHRRRHAS